MTYEELKTKFFEKFDGEIQLIYRYNKPEDGLTWYEIRDELWKASPEIESTVIKMIALGKI